MPLILTKPRSARALLEGHDDAHSVDISSTNAVQQASVKRAPLGGHDTVAPIGTKRIKLGPRPGPPPPMAVRVENRLAGHSPDGPLNLNTAFIDGEFSDEAKAAILRQLMAAPAGVIEAVVPDDHSINLSLLAHHVADLRKSMGMDFMLTLGVEEGS